MKRKVIEISEGNPDEEIVLLYKKNYKIEHLQEEFGKSKKAINKIINHFNHKSFSMKRRIKINEEHLTFLKNYFINEKIDKKVNLRNIREKLIKTFNLKITNSYIWKLT